MIQVSFSKSSNLRRDREYFLAIFLNRIIKFKLNFLYTISLTRLILRRNLENSSLKKKKKKPNSS